MKPKHPLAIRWFHWLNFPILSLMIFSGMLIYWAHDIYFVPTTYFEQLGMAFELAKGMNLHFLFMWFFVLNGIAYVSFTLLSGEWRELIPGRDALKEAFQVVLHDLGIRKEPLPPKKFNAAQQLAYTGVVLMGAGSLITGLAIYKPVQLAWLNTLMGGYPSARYIHFLLTIGYVLFFGMHITQVIRAGWHNFQAMVTGHE
jgi:thiosulfate reductase cytochrome b subunit